MTPFVFSKHKVIVKLFVGLAFSFSFLFHNKQVKFQLNAYSIYYRASHKVFARLYGYCGGSVDPIPSVFTQLHRSGFNLIFETLYESI